MEERKKKGIGLYWKILIIAGCIMAVAFALSFWPRLCDRYTDNIYPHVLSVNAHVTNLVPFAIGEILMFAGAIVLAATVILSVVFAVRAIVLKVRGGRSPRGFRFYRIWMKCILAIVVAVAWLYLFRWWIPFRGRVLGEPEKQSTFTLEELRYARNCMVETMNAACREQPRDADGRVIYEDKEAIYETVVRAMKSLSDRFPRLRGYYGLPKEAISSDFYEWMNIGGFTFSFSMEISVNRYVSRRYFYVLSCHEAAHNKGFFKENEAEFIAFLSSLASDDPRMVCEGVFDYFWDVDDAFYYALVDKYGEDLADMMYFMEPQPDALLFDDYAQAQEEAEELYAAEEHPLEEQFSEPAAEVADVGWETQDKLLAENSYSGVTRLILDYYAQQMRESQKSGQ